MNKIGVMIVDDSAFMRRMLRDIISEDDHFEVVGIVRDGYEALKKLPIYQPDVITLDVELPGLNGLAVLSEIMAVRPTPTVMLSSLTQRGTETTIEAMNRGAVDFIAKPSGAISLDIEKIKAELHTKLKHAAGANLMNVTNRREKATTPEPTVFKETFRPSKTRNIVCIGTSTGGPRALQQVIPNLPGDLQAPVLVVQHMPAKFTKSLADRLNTLSNLEVCEAKHGEILKNGTVYVAPGGYHMVIKSIGRALAIELNDDPSVHGVKPSVDTLYHSLAQLTDYHMIAAILTGMGKDGAQGLVAMKKSCQTFSIAESKESAIVFGMPKAAIETGSIDQICHLDSVSMAICNQFHHV